MWKKIRILILLIILLIVAVNAYRDQNQNWSKPIIVLLHPINADGLPTTQQYIQQLSRQDLNGAQGISGKSSSAVSRTANLFLF